ncbi:hypothetical protein GCM10010172_56870 [Paractinoplanes ferrugineus]|uniref:Uncharacterized protein n=1 Tax=Paractinoplanes ferrugineus TaxID=113564 RepID=A0A919J0T3_9ACTN|nr:hypothetical protein [Actinoplanes ferrugineus]GIE10843.1 hypothetical protein Afe05nite_26830 [Actinoplanes ferrugineus]
MTVLAHGIGRSTDLPLPLDLVLQAGAATVAISFLGSALLWRRPRLSPATERHPSSGWWLPPLRIAALIVSVYITANALLGPRDLSNPAARALYVWLWVGLIPLSLVFGPAWRALNPLRTIHRLLRLAIPARRRPSPTPEPATAEPPAAESAVARPPVAGPAAARPPALGPAALGPAGAGPGPAIAGPAVAVGALLGFVWLELIAPDRTDPLVIGGFLVAYAVVQLAFAARYGEDWFRRGDAFEIYSELAGRLSPLRWRPWLSGLATDHPAGFGRAAFLAVWWGSTIFDSASGSPAWAALVQRTGHPAWLGTAGLLTVCGLLLLGVRLLAGKLDITNSLIPIAAGYTLAHYLSLLLTEGPSGALLAVQQWGVAESASWTLIPDPKLISILQVVLILTGHALGVLAAHDLALADAPPGRPPLATLAAELPVVLFMIVCTWAGLFLLFVR